MELFRRIDMNRQSTAATLENVWKKSPESEGYVLIDWEKSGKDELPLPELEMTDAELPEIQAAALKPEKISSGDSILNWYLNEIHKIPMLSREEEFRIACLARDGDIKARDALARANLRFVVTVARKYQSNGLSIMDLINEGNLGLIKAAERFNPDRGFHFISYAVWWIKQSILFAIQQKAHLIRLPLNRTADLRRIEEAEKWIENQEGMDSNTATLCQLLGMKEDDVNRLLSLRRDHLSLDASFSDGDEYSLGDNIEDITAIRPDQDSEDMDLINDIEESMKLLSERERKVITMRFGLGGSRSFSLQKIGQKIGLSKERIRQIEKKAIRKIRTGKFGQQLVAYL